MKRAKTFIYAPGKGQPYNEAWSKEIAAIRKVLAPDGFTVTTGSAWQREPGYFQCRDTWPGRIVSLLLYVLIGARARTILLEIGMSQARNRLVRFLPYKGKVVYRCRVQVRHGAPRVWLSAFRGYRKVTVVSEEDRATLRASGIEHVEVHPFTFLSHTPPSPGDAGTEERETSGDLAPGTVPTFLFASAPLPHHRYPEIFEQKGLFRLLELAARCPHYRFVLVLRDAFGEVLTKLIEERGLRNVELQDGLVDMPRARARTHAGILVPQSRLHTPDYPSSLLESIAAGKPVVVNRTLLLHREVRAHGLGVVLSDDPDDWDGQLRTLFDGYADYRKNCRAYADEYLCPERQAHKLRRLLALE